MKKIVSLLVVLAMLIAMVPAVFAADTLVSGEYVMVASSGYAMGTYSSGWILAEDATSGDYSAISTWTITVNDDGTVKLADKNGVYIAPKGGNANGIIEGDYDWTVEVNEDGSYSFLGHDSDTVVLASNVGSENKFRGYKTTTVSGNPDGYPSTFTLVAVEGNGDDPGETPTPDPEPESPVGPTATIVTDLSNLADGDYVIWAPAFNKALSSNKIGTHYNAGVDVVNTDGVLSGFGETEIWTVTNNEDGTITIAQNGDILSQAGYSSMTMNAEYDSWNITDLSNNGICNIYNAEKTPGSYGPYFMEWYAQYTEFTTYATGADRAASGDAFKLQFASIDVAEEPAPELPTTLVDGDNAIEMVAGQTATMTYTATADGVLNLTLGDMMGYITLVDAEGIENGIYAGMAIGRGFVSITVDGTDFMYYNPIPVVVGQEVVVTFTLPEGGMGAAVKANLNVAIAEPPAPGASPDNPIVIESMPWTVTQTADQDVYYVFTPDQDGIIKITKTAGYVSLIDSVWETDDEGNYLVTVTAGTSISINPWGGDMTVTADWYVDDGEDPIDPPVDPDLPGDNTDYEINYDEQITTEGVYDVTMMDNTNMTIILVTPDAAGKYELVANSGSFVVCGGSEFYVIIPTDPEFVTTYEFEITDVGQSILVGITAEASLELKKVGEVDDTPAYETIIYENIETPVEFDDSKYENIEYVDITDDVIDEAVLGEDGYYHLNSADGPILYVSFFGPNAEGTTLLGAHSNGQVKYYELEDGTIISVTDYFNAMGEYMLFANNNGQYSYGNAYHPLTIDLIEMLEMIGKNNGWYGEGGWLGENDDAWMFFCVTMDLIETDDEDDKTPETDDEDDKTPETDDEDDKTPETDDEDDKTEDDKTEDEKPEDDKTEDEKPEDEKPEDEKPEDDKIPATGHDMLGVIASMIVSAMGVVALPVAKKRF